jgi:hypothetical protein
MCESRSVRERARYRAKLMQAEVAGRAQAEAPCLGEAAVTVLRNTRASR